MAAGPTAEAGARGRPRTARRLLPWIAAIALLGYLAWRVPLAELRRALTAGPWLALVLYTLPLATLTLAADVWATRAGLAAAGLRLPLRELALARGATYLAGLVSYAAGQGGLGVYFHRRGVPGRRAAGYVLFLLGINVAALVAAAWSGRGMRATVGGGGSGGPAGVTAAATPALVAAGVAVLGYLGLVALRPRRLAGRPILAPLFEAGVGGHFVALAARLPHVAVLTLGQWGALWIWGVRLPLPAALELLPFVLFVGALPIAPAGLGTTQAAQVLLLSPFAVGATAAAREATALGFGLAFTALGLVFQAATGGLCLALLARCDRRGEDSAA